MSPAGASRSTSRSRYPTTHLTTTHHHPGPIPTTDRQAICACVPFVTHDGVDIAEELIATIDATATGALHRAHLALQSDGESRGYDADEWLPLAYEQAADWLQHASPATDPPPLIDHAQQAGRFAALAIGSLDRDAPTVAEAITDCLAHLLFTCLFADAAVRSRSGG